MKDLENDLFNNYLNLDNSKNQKKSDFRNLVNLKYFGEVEINTDFDELELEELFFKNNNISIDVSIEDLNDKKLNIFSNFLNDLENIENKVFKELKNNFNNKGIDDYGARFYLNHHLEELDNEKLGKLINLNSNNKLEDLFNKLSLNRIGINTNELGENYAVFDYTLGLGITDGILAVYVDEELINFEITFES